MHTKIGYQTDYTEFRGNLIKHLGIKVIRRMDMCRVFVSHMLLLLNFIARHEFDNQERKSGDHMGLCIGTSWYHL